MNLKKLTLATGFTLIVAIALPLHAQTGCTDSPENPTVVLALVGAAGALFATVRSRLRMRRKSSQC
jgi:XrtJ-associated TM-motif-TM protein